MMYVKEVMEAEVVRSWQVEVSSLSQLDEVMRQLESEYPEAWVYYSVDAGIYVDWDF